MFVNWFQTVCVARYSWIVHFDANLSDFDLNSKPHGHKKVKTTWIISQTSLDGIGFAVETCLMNYILIFISSDQCHGREPFRDDFMKETCLLAFQYVQTTFIQTWYDDRHCCLVPVWMPLTFHLLANRLWGLSPRCQLSLACLEASGGVEQGCLQSIVPPLFLLASLDAFSRADRGCSYDPVERERWKQTSMYNSSCWTALLLTAFHHEWLGMRNLHASAWQCSLAFWELHCAIGCLGSAVCLSVCSVKHLKINKTFMGWSLLLYCLPYKDCECNYLISAGSVFPDPHLLISESLVNGVIHPLQDDWWESRMIPLHLLHCSRSPLFDSFTRIRDVNLLLFSRVPFLV